MDISRRAFLSGAAILGAGATMAGLSGCAQPKGASQREADERFVDTTAGHSPADVAECDMVVVGSGTAGVCATARAAELGANVILLERCDALGGSSYMAEGVAGTNTYVHERDGVSIDNSAMLQDTQSYHHWAADANVLKNYIEHSGATIDWLHETCGVNFLMATVTAPTSYQTWHLTGDENGTMVRLGPGLIKPVSEFALSCGADVRTLSTATGLVFEDDEVRGVYYTDVNGVEHEVRAKSVVLATGGYANNPDLFEKYSNISHSRIHNYGAFGRTGDGITWATELGAATHNIGTVMFASTYVPGSTAFEERVNWIFSWQPNLRVNEHGRRFMNETLSADFSVVSNAVLAQTQAYSVLDAAYLDDIENVALPVGMDSIGIMSGKPLPGSIDAIEQAVAEGRVLKADTLEGLAEAIGCDAETLVGTVDAYNSYCEAGADPDFGTPAASLRAISKPPFYAANIQPALFTTVGGLKVDDHWRVVKEDGSLIPNLFALGNDASSQVGHDYDVGVMSGSQQGWCATGGRMVAEYLFGESSQA